VNFSKSKLGLIVLLGMNLTRLISALVA